ncbi:multicopper oxidase domain-containing protein, partial [Streptomyces sp. NPDC041003]|uniref:multicopper oxidase domain-containing protein n=1 Tax=Streptomyces sp. NPDC041003 TaxID=3155730 RepID=UPI0033C36493
GGFGQGPGTNRDGAAGATRPPDGAGGDVAPGAETWTLRNDDGMPHNFHVHDVQFRILDINGAAPPPPLRGPKDTVFVPSGSTVRIALRFDGPADPDTPYMYHCHLLYHEDKGMMGQFVVVDPSRPPSTPKPPPTSGPHQH